MRKISDASELEHELRRLLEDAQSQQPSRSRIASKLRDLSQRVAADEYAPDLLTFRAFMSEFKQGVKEGAALALDIPHTLDPVGIHGREQEAADAVATAARDLMEYMRRITSLAERSSFDVNERRLIPKMSGMLSTFFYNLGKTRGLRKGSDAVEE